MDAQMKNFLIKCLVVTACLICILKSIPVSTYDFPNDTTRENKFTGKVERFSSYDHTWF